MKLIVAWIVVILTLLIIGRLFMVRSLIPFFRSLKEMWVEDWRDIIAPVVLLGILVLITWSFITVINSLSL